MTNEEIQCRLPMHHIHNPSSLATSLPIECMEMIFSFVGGNSKTTSSEDRKNDQTTTIRTVFYDCRSVGKLYKTLALVCKTWKKAADLALPSLATDLELVLEGEQLKRTSLFLAWLEHFDLQLSSIKVPNLFLKERSLLRYILQSVDLTNLKSLSLGRNEWHDPWGEPVYLTSLEKRQEFGDTLLQELVAQKCHNLERLSICLDLNGLDKHRPSEHLLGLKSIRVLDLTPVYSCYNLYNNDGGATPGLDLSFLTRLVSSFPVLGHLVLRGSCLKQAPSGKLFLQSNSLRALHGYEFPNHVWINVDKCPHLNPFYKCEDTTENSTTNN